jgi:ATP-dependent Lhr-like helicase
MDEALRNRADAWFAERGQAPFDFQREAWEACTRGESGIVHAATGTGKTLAAWLGPVMRHGATHGAGLRVLWITPLRALANDLVVHLREPLAPLGCAWQVALRTGDTSSHERQRQRKRPPDALVTTPESLSVLLSGADAEALLSSVATVIVDEWHELLGSKRGVQTELALARLRRLNPRLTTWGLSATLPNLDEALRTLLGPGRSGRLIPSSIERRIEIRSILPASMDRFPWAGHLGLRLLPDVLAAMDAARSTLLFTNTRSQAEIWYQAIVSTRLDWLTQVALHHGSIDRALREKAEVALRDGTLRAVVATSSLDLGIDFAPVDLVIQIGSPKGVARLMQRAGRSGHRPGETSRILCVPTHAFELVEIVAVRRAVAAGRLEPRVPLRRCLDVLAQHAVTRAAGGGFGAAELLEEVRGTAAFADLPDVEWHWVLDFITRGGDALAGYPEFRRVVEHEGRFTMASPAHARRHRLAIGTITSDSSMRVRWLKGGDLGSIEESFIAKLKPGQAFMFAGRVVVLARVRDMIAYVRRAPGAALTVPRWQGTKLPISATLGAGTRELLAARAEATDPELEAVAPVLAAQTAASALPAPDELLVERLESREGHHLFVYPFAGRIVHEGIATLLAFRLARATPRTFVVSVNEYGFELLSPSPLDPRDEELRAALAPVDLATDIAASMNVSELARRQFRGIAQIAGLVYAGPAYRSKTQRQLQASSGVLFDVLTRYDPGNPLLGQAQREVIESQLEFRELQAALRRIAAERLLVKEIARLTPLAFPLWADRLQTHSLSTESWQARVERAARRLEREVA